MECPPDIEPDERPEDMLWLAKLLGIVDVVPGVPIGNDPDRGCGDASGRG
jgi:hypothetical protein